MNKKVIFFLVFLFIISFVIRVWPLRVSHFWDESVYLQNAKTIFQGAKGYNELNFRPPLISILFGLAFLLWDNVFMAQLILGIIAAISIVYVYLIGKELYDEKVAIISSLMFALAPFLVLNSNFLLTDVPSLSLVVIFYYYLIKAGKTGKDIFFYVSGALFSLSILMRFTSLILLFVVPISFAIYRVNYKKILPFIVGVLLFLFPYLLWAQISQGFFLQPFIIAKRMVGDFNEPFLFYILNFNRAFGILTIVGIVVWLVNLLLKANSCFSQKRTDFLLNFKLKWKQIFNKNDLMLFIWIVLFLSYITITPHKELRYIIPISLPVVLLGAKGIGIICNKVSLIQNKGLKYLGYGLIVLLFLSAFYPSFIKLKEPLISSSASIEMMASKFIVENYPEQVIIYSNHNYPIFAYHTGYKTLRLENQDEQFYDYYAEEMNESGIIIVYNNTNKYPKIEWLNNNSEFNYSTNIEEIFIYEYNKTNHEGFT